MSISSGSGAGDLKDCFKYNVVKWDSAFTFGLNAAKITDKIKKSFK